MDRPVYSLHLFAGAGGGLLADLLSGVQPVCAVEIEPHPQRVLARRFPGLAIWDDVQTFRADNPDCADAFAWMREHRDGLVVAGGFPCQDISCAGKGGGVEGGERSGLWREFARILGEVRPRFAFVENSPFLVGRGLGIVLGDLASLGYDARWQVLAAGDVGARHLRERIWIAASLRDGLWTALQKRAGITPPRVSRLHPAATTGTGATTRTDSGNATSTTSLFNIRRPAHTTDFPGGGNSEMNRHTPGLNAIAARYPTPTASEDHARANGDTQASRCLGALGKVGPSAQLNPDWVEWLMGWPVGWTDITRAVCDWRDLSNEPEDIGISTTRRDNRPARIKAIGNGQVPLCAAIAAESGFAFLEAVHELHAASAATRAAFPAQANAGRVTSG